jgi:hypothetical protein
VVCSATLSVFSLRCVTAVGNEYTRVLILSIGWNDIERDMTRVIKLLDQS